MADRRTAIGLGSEPIDFEAVEFAIDCLEPESGQCVAIAWSVHTCVFDYWGLVDRHDCQFHTSGDLIRQERVAFGNNCQSVHCPNDP